MSSSYYYGSTPTTSSVSSLGDVEGIIGAVLGLGAFMLILIGIAAIITIIGQWKMFQKANKEGCLALIPVANVIEELRMSGLNIALWFLTFVAIIPVIGWLGPIVFTFVKNIKLAKAFGKGAGFGVLLTFFPFVMYPILGFGSAQYQGPENN